jgi:large subunit ribosomal protein L9
MDVILLKVKAGFARNFLLPKRKALRATKENREVFEKRRTQLEADNLKRKEEAEKVAAKINGLKISIVRQAAEGGSLYGSVSLRDIAEEITNAGFTIQKSQVMLGQPIKTTGIHDVRISLHPEVRVSVTVNVARSTEEADAAQVAAEEAPAAEAPPAG